MPRSKRLSELARRGELSVFVMLCALVLFGPAPVATSQIDYIWDFELNKGRVLLRREEFDEALKSFKRANEMLRDAGKTCADCFNLMAEAYIGLESYKKAVEVSDQALVLAGDNKKLASQAYNNKGLALQTWANKKDQKKLQAAEAVFRQGLAIAGAIPELRYNLGVMLLQMNRDPEGIAELQQYIDGEPGGKFIETAKKMATNPRRARENYAPDFSFTSSDGKQISLEDLQGKVVLLDFWGTWCGPCVESVPDLRQLHKKYSQDPAFVLIGISSDREEDVWREFTEKNKMVWLQYRDRDRRIQRAFEVSSFPTYVIIDHEGIVRHRSVGVSWSGSAGLDSAIKKQMKLIAKSTASQQ
jgi:peroxiredoxin